MHTHTHTERERERRREGRRNIAGKAGWKSKLEPWLERYSYLSMYSFGKYLLRTYYVPSNVEIIINKPNRTTNLYSSWEYRQTSMTQLENCFWKVHLMIRIKIS